VSAHLPRQELERLASPVPDDPRSIRRQRLVAHLAAAGTRPVLEALIAVEAGQPLDAVLTDFARLPTAAYRSVGADRLPMRSLAVIKGGRRE
jgi:hypothetical protein